MESQVGMVCQRFFNQRRKFSDLDELNQWLVDQCRQQAASQKHPEFRDRYYDLLQAVRREGGWETWLEFFLQGVLETSGQAVATARRLQELFNSDRQRVAALGRASGSVLRLHDYLQNKPIVTIQKAAEATGLTRPTIATAFKLLADLKIVRELTGKERHRLFVYDEYITILNEGATPLR